MDIENAYGTLEMQQYLLPVLIDIDKFCMENDINYSLSDGSLLGAIRHKGFIPWDDDIDLSLDRENFNKFLAAAEKGLPEQYEILHDTWIRRITRKDNPQKNAFPAVGCIDLFVFDQVPKSKKKEKCQVFLLKTLQGMLKVNVNYEGFSIQKKTMLFITHYLGFLFPRKEKQRWYDAISQWGNNDESGNTIARFNASYRGIDHVRYPSDMLESYVRLEFEGCTFMSFSGWEKFLTIMYGDYMKVPEKNARKTTHEHVGLKE